MFHAQIGGDDESERRLVSLEALEGVRQVWLIADARDVPDSHDAELTRRRTHMTPRISVTKTRVSPPLMPACGTPRSP